MAEPNFAATASGADPRPRGSLGTFAGVFTPSILTILGIILFLRMGYVVGSAGVTRAILIVFMANAISVLTSISLAAIATNIRVRGGGDYYLISRTLGVEYGGALGIVLFLAQSVSIAFYAIGFGEAIGAILGNASPWFPQAVAAGAVAILFVLAWLGSDWATRFQYVVMTVLVAALVAFFAGGIPGWDAELFRANLEPSQSLPFWTIFAIFFPAVTGFTQGVSMSGDLANPGRSIPRGTFIAVGLSMLVYIVVAVIFAGALPGATLAQDMGSMRRISSVAWLVDAGVIAATLSSALASFMGAPRILQSLAADRVFPILNAFSVGSGPNNNPRRGVILAAAIAFVTIVLGNLNVIAPVVSMFFLISYGLLNYATYFEARANSPSFRPRFRWFHARLSLVGCLACLGAMLAINPTAGATAVAVLFAIHQWVANSVEVERWADSARSRRIQRVREDLHAISADLAHPRDWRPVVLVFTDSSERRARMLRFASWLEGGSGFTTAVRLLYGSGARARRRRQEAEDQLRAEISKRRFPAFAMAVVSDDLDDALPAVLQAHGLGRLRTNTVLLNWYDRVPEGHGDPGLQSFPRYVRHALRCGSNVVMLAAGEQNFQVLETLHQRRRIDVWYRNNASGRLMLLLAYLMTRSEFWEESEIRLFVPLSADVDREQVAQDVAAMLDKARIKATPELIDQPSAMDVARLSSDAGVVFLPFRMTDDGPEGVFEGDMEQLVEALGITILVLACQDINLDADPEAGKHGEIAQAMDAATRALKTAKKLSRTAEQSRREAEELTQKIVIARRGGVATDELARLEKAAVEAADEADRARRRAAKGQAKADQAAAEAKAALGEDDAPSESDDA